jgi:hypothetical protein
MRFVPYDRPFTIVCRVVSENVRRGWLKHQPGFLPRLTDKPRLAHLSVKGKIGDIHQTDRLEDCPYCPHNTTCRLDEHFMVATRRVVEVYLQVNTENRE